MDKRINSEVSFKPSGIYVFRFLVDREGDCSDYSNAGQWCSDAAKETSISLSLVGITDTFGEAFILICLHASLHRIQRELVIVSSCLDRSLARTYSREGRQNTTDRRGNLSPISLDESLLLSSSI
jgi:hypothetical protein